jgi:hypothetical protein
VFIFKTGEAIIIGTYDETQQACSAINTVEKLGDYLLKNGY